MDGKEAVTDFAECCCYHYILIFDDECEDAPWRYAFSNSDRGAVMITNNGQYMCTICLSQEELRSVLDVFG